MNDWIATTAQKIAKAHPDETKTLTLASGISPSGPIHMGNLREIFTTHFIVDELKSMGRNARHILSWDDYDRYRKVPAGVNGVDDSWVRFIGMPLTAVPAPLASDSENWAEHFKSEFRTALKTLGVNVEEISQTYMYESGAYNEQIINSMNMRMVIGEVLASYQTKGTVLNPADYYPFKPYCGECGTDSTTVTNWSSECNEISYHCVCGYETVANISEVSGKLVWKVDWPMRWAYEGVVFEPGGVDHMSPGSSWDVGAKIAPLFDFVRPMGLRYSFVGIDGAAKISSSAGGAPIPNDILKVLSPEIVRWLYCRQRPEQAFTIDMVNNTSRLYEEWDNFTRKFTNGKMKDFEASTFKRAMSSFENASAIDFDNIQIDGVKFSAWVSFADITLCNENAMLDLARLSTGGNIDESRMKRAVNWVNIYMPNDERTVLSGTFRKEYYESLSGDEQAAIILLAQELDKYSGSIGELTRWSFGAAKAHLGIDIDERNLSPEAKEFQKSYFKNVYQLLIGRDSGPRLPLLIHLIGVERARELLVGKSF